MPRLFCRAVNRQRFSAERVYVETVIASRKSDRKFGLVRRRGEVGVNIIKRVFIEERVRASAKDAARVRSRSMRKPSSEDLHHDLDETQGIINILERASRELSTIIDWDEGLRKNPLRHRQLASIGQQIAIARGKQTSVARMIERLESRP